MMKRLKNAAFSNWGDFPYSISVSLILLIIVIGGLFDALKAQASQVLLNNHINTTDSEIPEYHFLHSGTLKYVAYIPEEEALKPGKRYPLVLYLHGSCGECTTHQRITRESNLQFWHNYSENTQVEPTFVIAPAGGRSGWTDSTRRDIIFGIVDRFVSDFPIDPHRIYITGFSMGGRGTWNYIHYRPDFFAAANPQGISPGDVDPEIVRSIPIWATIGGLDRPERVKGLQDTVAKLRAANGDSRGALSWETGVNPRFTIFPETDHGGVQTATQQIPGFKEWIYAQRLDGNHTPNVFFKVTERIQEYTELPAEVPFTVVSNDPDGDKLQIDIRLNGVILEDPWTIPDERGEITLETAGEHMIEAIATDSGGKSAVSTLTLNVGQVKD